MLNRLACLCPIGQGHTQGSTSKIVFDTIACRRGVNVNESERERSRIICGQFVQSGEQCLFFEVPSTLAPKNNRPRRKVKVLKWGRNEPPQHCAAVYHELLTCAI